MLHLYPYKVIAIRLSSKVIIEANQLYKHEQYKNKEVASYLCHKAVCNYYGFKFNQSYVGNIFNLGDVPIKITSVNSNYYNPNVGPHLSVTIYKKPKNCIHIVCVYDLPVVTIVGYIVNETIKKSIKINNPYDLYPMINHKKLNEIDKRQLYV